MSAVDTSECPHQTDVLYSFPCSFKLPLTFLPSMTSSSNEQLHLDYITHPLHTDCTSFHHGLQVLALTSYQLNESESSSETSSSRSGSVHFYSYSSLIFDSTQEAAEKSSNHRLEAVKVQIDSGSLSDILPLSSGVFDIRWSSQTAYKDLKNVNPFGIMVIALSDGSIRQYKVEWHTIDSNSPSEAQSSQNSASHLLLTTCNVFPCESDGDMALGVDLASISLSEYESDLVTPFSTTSPSSSDINTAKKCEYAAVGYQSGGVAVWDLESNSSSPIWSCPDAHMAEVWQIQFIGDEAFVSQELTSSGSEVQDPPPETFGINSMAFGRRCGNLFVSGSDDASFKIWDLRADPSEGPVMQNRRYYKMGVTSFASPLASPSQSARSLMPFGLLVGSYDESLSMWDLRAMRNPAMSIGLGGGVWRIRWLPQHVSLSSTQQNDTGIFKSSLPRVAVAAMHAGFKVVEIGCGGTLSETPVANSSSLSFKTVADYWGPHKGSEDGKFPPLAYGIDWVTVQQSSSGRSSSLPKNPTSALLAGCTFYDNCLSIWNPLYM